MSTSHVSPSTAPIPASICLAGPDGAGKSTQAERLVQFLAERGRSARICTIWDLFERSGPGGIPFASKRDIDRFLGSLHADGRAMFLHMAMREALDRAIADRGDAILVVVGYWPKYNATERVYGAAPALLDALAAAFPPLELNLFLALDPQAALARKPIVSGYESGQKGREGFLAFQQQVQKELNALMARDRASWFTIDGSAPVDAVAEAIATQVSAWLGRKESPSRERGA